MAVTPDVVMDLTRRWADEVSGPNKSIASLAHHRALLRAREEGEIDQERWDLVMTHLGEQASRYGMDHEARRRSAWVGMCVCGDWSMLEGRQETIGEASPVGVLPTNPYYGPDWTLLQQLASRWEELRSEFGDSLLTRLSGIRERQPRKDVWNSLALVAAQNATLEQELEDAVADDPDLLELNGVFAWFVSRGSKKSNESVADVLVSHTQKSRHDDYSPTSLLVAESELVGRQRDEIRVRLEDAFGRVPASVGDLGLQTLAVLFPDHPRVRDAWQEVSSLIADRDTDHPVHAPTYFAVAYAAAESSQILKQIERNLDRMTEFGLTRYDYIFTRHVSYRLRRDTTAADMIRNAVMDPATPDSKAALLVSHLVEATGLDEALINEVERRISAQDSVSLAPVLRDRTASVTLSVRTLLTRVVDAAWNSKLA